MSHLTEQDRCRIENLLNADLSPLAIIRQENRAHSTIVRELRKHRKENESDRRQKKKLLYPEKQLLQEGCLPVSAGELSWAVQSVQDH